jgi:hypothetical protein
MARRRASGARLLAAILVALALGACGKGTLGTPGAGDGDDPFAPPVLSTLADEIPLVQPRVQALRAALDAKDPEAAAATFTPETTARYEAFFEANRENLPKLSEALAQGELVVVGEHEIQPFDGSTRRLGDLAVTVDGIVFHVTMVKVDGTWLFASM